MDHKTFKSDLTYTCKKFSKEGKILSVDDGYLSLDNEGKITMEGNQIGILEALVLVKGYTLSKQQATAYHEKWQDKDEQWHEMRWMHHQAFGINPINIVEEQAQIAKDDIYAFLNGLENVEWLGSKNDFYDVGVYIREKFIPLGTRTEPLRHKIYETIRKGEKSMKGFVVHTRPVPCTCKKTDAPTIVEVEYQHLSSLEDPSILYLPSGESRARILKPEFLWEPKELIKSETAKKEKVMVPPTYHSHSVFQTLEQARAKAYELVESGFKFALRKQGTQYTQEEVQVKAADVQEVMLP